MTNTKQSIMPALFLLPTLFVIVVVVAPAIFIETAYERIRYGYCHRLYLGYNCRGDGSCCRRSFK